jgi:hypothetical protein
MIAPIVWALFALGALTPLVTANPEDGLPSYHYGAPIPVECMNRNSYVLSLDYRYISNKVQRNWRTCRKRKARNRVETFPHLQRNRPLS